MDTFWCDLKVHYSHIKEFFSKGKNSLVSLIAHMQMTKILKKNPFICIETNVYKYVTGFESLYIHQHQNWQFSLKRRYRFLQLITYRDDCKNFRDEWYPNFTKSSDGIHVETVLLHCGMLSSVCLYANKDGCLTIPYDFLECIFFSHGMVKVFLIFYFTINPSSRD